MLKISIGKCGNIRKNDMCKRFYNGESMLYDVPKDKALSNLIFGCISRKSQNCFRNYEIVCAFSLKKDGCIH